jgi:hypothetical protein
MKLLTVCILLNIILSTFEGQDIDKPDPETILEKVKSNFRTIVDFKADVEIEINVDFINIPNKEARIIYKYPNKIKFKSKSFLMIPRKGIGFSVFELLEDDYSAIYTGTKLINDRELVEIKVVPLSDRSEIVLATLYIDSVNYLIHYMEATRRKSGFFTTEFMYGDEAPLPDSNRIRFEVDEMRLPLRFIGKATVDKSKMKQGTVGEIILRYDGYVINQGLEDSLFEEDSIRIE